MWLLCVLLRLSVCGCGSDDNIMKGSVVSVLGLCGSLCCVMNVGFVISYFL